MGLDACLKSIYFWIVNWVKIGILGHFFLWIEVILFLEALVSIAIGLQWINDVGDPLSQLVVLVEDPGVLIWELLLVLWIWLLWSVVRSDSGLEVLLLIGFEQVLQ